MPCMTNELQKKCTLDSCIGRRCYENQAYLDMLKIKIDFRTSDIVFTTVSKSEINRGTEYGFEAVRSRLESSIEREIKVEEITSEIEQLGCRLVKRFDELHVPDNLILASALWANSVLITCDRGLERTARAVNQMVINPDKAIIDFTNTKSASARWAKAMTQEIKEKISKQARTVKKPATKIVWSAFV